jgi:tetratricopeptide (TPR) repeat protein
MVLGEDLFLTAEDLNNLPFVPELAFLNCCHLARMPDGGAGPAVNQERLHSANRLAASLAEALIKRGAKAVVAAGWAVNDAAALTFASDLYGQLLANESFGRAVLHARQEVFRKHERTNTWGAYQCYGDPYFRLNIDLPEQAAAEPQTRDDILTRIRNLAAEIPITPDREQARRSALDVYRSIPVLWRDGEILGSIGDVLRDLGEFEAAIGAYTEAAQDPNSGAPIRIIEQLGNLQDRYARDLAKRASEATGPAQTELLGRVNQLTASASKNLEWVLSLGPTPERLALLGGMYKRSAGTEAARSLEYLEKSAEYYRQAHEMNPHDPYPLLNWLTLRAVVAKQKGEDQRPELLPLIAGARRVVEERIATNDDFWSRVGVPDSELLERLVEGTLPQHVNDIKKAYQKVIEPGTSERTKQSVRAQIGWIREFWPDAADAGALIEIERSIG